MLLYINGIGVPIEALPLLTFGEWADARSQEDIIEQFDAPSRVWFGTNETGQQDRPINRHIVCAFKSRPITRGRITYLNTQRYISIIYVRHRISTGYTNWGVSSGVFNSADVLGAHRGFPVAESGESVGNLSSLMPELCPGSFFYRCIEEAYGSIDVILSEYEMFFRCARLSEDGESTV